MRGEMSGFNTAMGGARVVVVVVAALVGVGSFASWFTTSVGRVEIEEGVFATKVCGFGIGDEADELEEFGRYQATGVRPAPKPWRCERELNVLRIRDVREPVDAVAWLLAVIPFVAGLALAVLVLLAARGRPRRRLITAVAIVALASVIAYGGSAILLGGYEVTDLSFGAVAYVAGAVLAIVCARRWAASSRVG